MIDNKIILFKFIQTNKNVDWHYISDDYKLSENFIKKFQIKLIGLKYHINKNYQKILYENFKIKLIGIEYHINKNYENFIREFKNKVNWSEISIFQELSENFIKEFKYRVD